MGPIEGTPPLAPEESAPTVGLLAAVTVAGGPGPFDEGLWGCDVDGAPKRDGGGLGVEVMS